jgi:hypothetical protein
MSNSQKSARRDAPMPLLMMYVEEGIGTKYQRNRSLFGRYYFNRSGG